MWAWEGQDDMDADDRERERERDSREWKISSIDPHDRHTWRSGVRSIMRAASQLSGRGPSDVNVALVSAC